MMFKIFFPLIALALASPFNLADFDNGADIYARSGDSVTSQTQITIDGTEINDFPFSFESFEEKTYTIVQGDNTYTLHIDDTAPAIEITGVEDGRSYKSANVNVNVTGESEKQLTVDGEEIEYEDVLSFTENGSHTITVKAKDEAGNESEKTVSFSINNVDPVISITGLDKEIKNSSYEIKASISAGSPVVSKKAVLDGTEVNIFDDALKVEGEGRHTLSVECTDEAGNSASVEKTFTIDLTAPKIDILVNDSRPEAGGYFRTASVKIGITGESERSIRLNGQAKESEFTVSEDGKYTLTVTAKDEAGNTSEETLKFSILNEGPAVTVSGIDKDLKNSTYNIKITTRSELETTDVIKLNGEERIKDGLPEKEFSVSDEGVYKLEIESTDTLGNKTKEEINFEIDKTDPKLVLDAKDGYQNRDVDYSVFAADKNLDVTTLRINGEPKDLNGKLDQDGVYRLVAVSKDKAGNSSRVEKTVILDKTKPEIEINDVKYTRDLTDVRAKVTDVNPDTFSITAKHKDLVITTGDVGNTELSLPEDAKGNSASDVWNFTFTAKDKAGNITTETKSIIRDTTVPKITLVTPSGHVNKNQKITAKISDPNEESSVMLIYKDGKKYDEIKGKANLTRVLTEEGTYTINIHSVDKAGNESSSKASFVLDKTPPVTTLRTSSGHVQRAQEITTASNEQGTTYLKVTCDGKTVYEKTVKGPQRYPYLGGNGVYNVSSYSVDLAGNRSTTKTGTFTVDTVAPKISLTGARQNSYINTPVTITAECDERFYPTTNVSVTGRIAETGESVSIPFSCRGEHTSISETFSKNGTYHLRMTAVDAAGNSASTNELVFTVDTERPVVEITVPSDGRYNSLIAPKVTIRDDYFESKDISLSMGKDLHFKDSFDAKGGTRTYSDFARLKENDGRYTLTARATDKAGNSTTVSKTFIVNRFGSVFKTVKKPSEYGKKADRDVVITETNVAGIKSWRCDISKDALISEAKNVSVKTDGDVSTYTIPKSEFAEDGIYKVFITSEDKSGNTSKSEGEFSFVIDNAPPVITYKGIEEGKIYKENSRKVYITATDTLTKDPDIKVTSDGRGLKVKKDETGTYAELHGGVNQTIKIKATDKAGNSASQEIKNVTVSTSKLAFFSAHKGLTAGLGAGVVGTAGALALLLARKRKKDEKEDKGDDLTF